MATEKPSYLRQNEFGQEIPDDTPVVIHIKGQTISQFDQVREFIRRELREHQTGEIETFEDANDFDVEDDLFPVSAAEYTEDTEAADREVIAAAQARPAAAPTEGKPSVGTGGLGGGSPPVSPPPAGVAGGTPPPQDQ